MDTRCQSQLLIQQKGPPSFSVATAAGRNSQCSRAELLKCGRTVTGTTVGVPPSTVQGCSAGGRLPAAWYFIYIPFPGDLTMTVSGGVDFGVTVEVMAGCSVPYCDQAALDWAGQLQIANLAVCGQFRSNPGAPEWVTLAFLVDCRFE